MILNLKNAVFWAILTGLLICPFIRAQESAPDISEKYIARLQQQVKESDNAALRGASFAAQNDLASSVEEYRKAIDLLPEAQVTTARRTLYTKKYAESATVLARQYADGARYGDAMTLLETILSPNVAPDNIEAKRLLEQLNDPRHYSPALTPKHLEKVQQVRSGLIAGDEYREHGNFDDAEREFHKVLSIDRYNTAARRSLEQIERDRIKYYQVARDHARAKFLRKVEEGWECPVPVGVKPPDIEFGGVDSTIGIRTNEEKLKRIVIPSLEFEDTPLRSALDFIQRQSVNLDNIETDVNKKGVNIILDAALSGSAGGDTFGGFGDGGGGTTASSSVDTPVTLKLTQVPLGEAIRYTTGLANLKYKVENHAIVVVPLSSVTQELFTRSFTVAPTFLTGGGGGGAAAGPVDPFAPSGGSNTSSPATRPTAKQVLETAGITFPTGATAIFNPGSSILVVRNTPEQLDLVQNFVEESRTGGEKQIYITSKFVEISESVGEELGFDWLLGAFSLGSDSVFGAGGTIGNSNGVNLGGDFSLFDPALGTPVGLNPVTSALRSGSRAIDTNSIDALLASGGDEIAVGNSPSVFGIAGVFTEPQFQVAIRALQQKTGVDLLSAPSVMARSGNRATIEVIQEFIYPTEYDPPELPNNVGLNNVTQQNLLNPLAPQTTATGFPVTPANPTAFEVRNVGVTLEVDPVLGADNYTIDLNLAPEVVEFEGFVNYGSPITSPAIDALGQVQNVVITENRIELPIFATRRVTTQVTLWDGQTVALGGLIREDIQDVEDKIPFIGDLPVIGRLFRNNVELHLKSNLTIFVSAEIVDPAGQRIHGRDETELPNYVEPDNFNLPSSPPVPPNFGTPPAPPRGSFVK